MNKNMRVMCLGCLAIIAAATGCAPPPAERRAPEASTPSEPAATAVSAPAITAPATMAPSAAEAQSAIEEANAAVRRAEGEGVQGLDSKPLLAEADAALQAGDTTRAIELAGQARRRAEDALAQKRSEQAPIAGRNLATRYDVLRGESLWSISGKAEIYGNPYHWPLIYKANRDMIQDADRIYPGQTLSIRRDLSSADMAEAARHARNRGAWSPKTEEASDRAYMGR